MFPRPKTGRLFNYNQKPITDLSTNQLCVAVGVEAVVVNLASADPARL